MRDIRFTLLILACRLSMLAMSAAAWIATKVRSGRPATPATGETDSAK